MTPGEALDTALSMVGKVAVVRGRDFQIEGAVTRVDSEGITIGVPRPYEARDRLGVLRAYHDFTVPLDLVVGIGDPPARERRLS